MQTQNLHRIRKQTIEISFESSGDSKGLQNLVADMFYEKLQPRMEALFDTLFGQNRHVAIDRLEIDLGYLNQKNWEQNFTEQAMIRLKDELEQVNNNESNLNKTEESAAEEAFFFFLENGFMPWNKHIDSIAELEQLLRINDTLINQLKKLVAQKSKAAERLVWQFSKDFTSRIIAEITKDRENALTEIFDLLEKLNLLQGGKLMEAFTNKQIDKHIVDAAILNLFASDTNKNKAEQFFAFLLTKVNDNKELQTEIREIISYLNINNNSSEDILSKDGQAATEDGKSTKSSKKKREINKDEFPERDKPLESIYINNAGLVLLHPFLQALFQQLDLNIENNWTDRPSQLQAILVSEFLVTGTVDFQEFNLMLNKIICGIDLEEIVITEIVINKQIIDVCDELLQSAIAHWSALKNTGIAAFRETFLRRSGKLSKVDDGWLLQVEHKSVDVLLNQLPWGIGIVKLPWMNEILYVEWA